jgi:F-box protein 42
MYVHCLDLSQVAATRTATWLPLTEYGAENAPDETLFYSLAEGRGELIMFGGIQTDVNNMRRLMQSGHVVSNMVYFLNPKKLLR